MARCMTAARRPSQNSGPISDTPPPMTIISGWNRAMTLASASPRVARRLVQDAPGDRITRFGGGVDGAGIDGGERPGEFHHAGWFLLGSRTGTPADGPT